MSVQLCSETSQLEELSTIIVCAVVAGRGEHDQLRLHALFSVRQQTGTAGGISLELLQPLVGRLPARLIIGAATAVLTSSHGTSHLLSSHNPCHTCSNNGQVAMQLGSGARGMARAVQALRLKIVKVRRWKDFQNLDGVPCHGMGNARPL